MYEEKKSLDLIISILRKHDFHITNNQDLVKCFASLFLNGKNKKDINEIHLNQYENHLKNLCDYDFDKSLFEQSEDTLESVLKYIKYYLKDWFFGV